MLLQRLREFAEMRISLPPMYQEQSIRYVFELDASGRLLGVIDTADKATRATERGTRRLSPHVKRANAIKPKLLADTGVYALGVPTAEARPERVRQQREAFAELVRACAVATDEPTVGAVVRFLDGLDAEPPELPTDFDPGATLTFRVDGVFPIDLPAVRAFWARVQGPSEDEDGAPSTLDLMTCLVCGQRRPALSRHPLKIKGIPGGQTAGTDLISANAGAFESYGLKASLIAPTCQECAEAYGNALNALLGATESSLRLGGNLAFAFWTVAETDFDPVRMFSTDNSEDVRELIRAYEGGARGAVEIDPTAFYAVALGASGARVAVRDWLDTTVGEAKRRMGRYFALQELIGPYGEDWQPLPLWRLVNSTVRDARKEPPPIVASALVGLALRGDPLPLDLLFLAVRRNRAEQGVTRERATLISMVLRGNPQAMGGDPTMGSELDAGNRRTAYRCGRLLAVLDAIQRQALGNPNATIVDKFYGTASSAPASVFGTLLHGTQAHLGKLRKDPRTEGAYHALERRLEEVLSEVEEFPHTLTLQDQGLFALGFYHQRANDRKAARERREAREKAASGDDVAGVGEAVEVVPPPDEQVSS